MARIRRFLAAVATVALILLGVVLGIDNHTPITLRFLNKESPQLALFWWLYAAFLIGALVGCTLCSLGFVRGKLHAPRNRKPATPQDDTAA